MDFVETRVMELLLVSCFLMALPVRSFLLTPPGKVVDREFPALDHIRPSASLDDQAQAAHDLIGRVIGPRANQFKVVIEGYKGTSVRDTFNIISTGQLVTITATSGVAAAMGFYHFIKTKCGCQYTWAGAQLNLPTPLPVILSPGLTVTSNDRFRYYQNVCTVSYSFVWWNWTRWEREIDWMAMNGINLPLAFTGQEAIFQKVYLKMGFTHQDLDAHFGGPGFLAWARMGNIDGWGGPLPQTWIDNQLALQHKILTRMRSLGMIPVLPGFAGHVPQAITRVFPNASVSRLGNWGRFNQSYCCTYLLDFQDPLFQQIGTAFINEMKSEFGVDHIYNADSFNEMEPKSSDPSYLKTSGAAVYRAMTSADPDAIWLMQGWLFQDATYWKPPQIKALLQSVPIGKMIVLDLFAEIYPIYSRTESFYGQPFIWCMLHNFGGVLELYGDLEDVNKGPFLGRSFANSTMIGTGLTPEGIFQNEVVYELMNENAIATQPRNLTEWVTQFHTNRYGAYSSDADKAWQLLKRSVYSAKIKHEGKNGYLKRPSLRPFVRIWYNPADLYNAWAAMVQAAQHLSTSELFRYDLVDVTRNSLQIISLKYYSDMVSAYRSNNSLMLNQSSVLLLSLLNDLETILGSDSHFLLGSWIQAARDNGVSAQEKDLMEFNVRNQLTLWGPRGEIRDYAAKQWSGLISGYYFKRWSVYIDLLKSSLAAGTKWNTTLANEMMFEQAELPFNQERKVYPVTPTGDPVAIAISLLHKYKPVLYDKFFNRVSGWSSQGRKRFIYEARKWTVKQWRREEMWKQRSLNKNTYIFEQM